MMNAFIFLLGLVLFVVGGGLLVAVTKEWRAKTDPNMTTGSFMLVLFICVALLVIGFGLMFSTMQ